MERKITTNFEAKTEQNINYSADFGGIPRAVGNFFELNQFQVLGNFSALRVHFFLPVKHSLFFPNRNLKFV